MRVPNCVIACTICLAGLALASSAPSIGSPAGHATETSSRIGGCWWSKFDVLLEWSSRRSAGVRGLDPQVQFMERNTGIEVKKDVSVAGYLIQPPQLRRAIHKWLDWYIDNYPYLHWDSDQRVFHVDPDAKALGRTTDLPRAPDDPTDKCYPSDVRLEGMLEVPQ